MVENKRSAFESEQGPPFAESTPQGPTDADLLHLDALPAEPVTPSAPPASLDRSSSTTPSVPDSVEEIPNLPTDEDRKIGAGVATGVVGLLIGGPFLALLFGFGAAYAVDKEGAAGDTARAVGDLALDVKQKAKEIDNKHHVVDRSKVVAKEAWEKAQEIDRQHHLLEKGRAFLVVAWTETVDFVRRHNLIERGVEGVGRGLEWLTAKIFAARNNLPEPVPTSEPRGPYTK